MTEGRTTSEPHGPVPCPRRTSLTKHGLKDEIIRCFDATTPEHHPLSTGPSRVQVTPREASPALQAQVRHAIRWGHPDPPVSLRFSSRATSKCTQTLHVSHFILTACFIDWMN